MNVQEIAVFGLHGRLNIKVPIKDNKVIMTGRNGIGKSTVLNILCFTLSRQWHRLCEYEFKKVSIKIAGRRFTIEKNDIELFSRPLFRRQQMRGAQRLSRRVSGGIRPSVLREIRRDPREAQDFLAQDFSTMLPSQERYYSRKLRVPRSYLLQLRGILLHEGFSEQLDPEDESEIVALDKFLREKLNHKIIYLPTYRRIEKELEAIFPGLSEDYKEFGSTQLPEENSSLLIELVQFGMDDVGDLIRHTLRQLKDDARTNLNNLATTYLREVIRGEAAKFEIRLIRNLDDDKIDRILGRIEEPNLMDQDKDHLRGIITALKKDSSNRTENDSYVAHYFGKVVDIFANIFEKEMPIRNFVSVCNSYLEDKKLVYDENAYTLDVRGDDGTKIRFRYLSSGEKQIVSLFAHIYLSEGTNYFIIIDEPELSLSVDWQERLLPDILASGSCHFLAAVTHSPFIFNNALDESAIDLQEKTVVKSQ